MMDEAWKKFFDPRVLERLRGMRLRTQRAAEGHLVGAHRSPRSGQAVEFSEHRQYVAGDDLRQLDWKVLGRTDKFYLRRREAETTLDCHLILDCSGSMAYRGGAGEAGGAGGTDKLTYALRVAASLAFVAAENHDSVSLTSVGGEVRPRLALGGGPGHLLALASAMDRITADGDGAPADRWELATRQVVRGGLVVWIGDFFDDSAEAWTRSIRAVRSSGRPMLVIQVVDPAEEAFPFREVTEYVGLEGEPPLAVDAQGVAAAYRQQFARHRQQLHAGCRACETPFWSLRTDQPLEARLPELVDRLAWEM